MVGIVADGIVRVLLGAAFIVGAPRIGHQLDVPVRLMTVSGMALLVGGGTEIRYVRSRPRPSRSPRSWWPPPRSGRLPRPDRPARMVPHKV